MTHHRFLPNLSWQSLQGVRQKYEGSLRLNDISTCDPIVCIVSDNICLHIWQLNQWGSFSFQGIIDSCRCFPLLNDSSNLPWTIIIMPTTPQQSCTAPECQYITPENVPTWELLTQQLSIHQKSAHPDPVHQGGGGVGNVARGGQKKVGDSFWMNGPGINGKPVYEINPFLMNCGAVCRMSCANLPLLRGGHMNLRQRKICLRGSKSLQLWPSTPLFMLLLSTNPASKVMKMSKLLQHELEVYQLRAALTLFHPGGGRICPPYYIFRCKTFKTHRKTL